MHTGSQALISGDALQQHRELRPLLVCESSAERILMLPGKSPDHFEGLSPPVRQKQSVTAPIVRVVATFDQASCFEFIGRTDNLVPAAIPVTLSSIDEVAALQGTE